MSHMCNHEKYDNKKSGRRQLFAFLPHADVYFVPAIVLIPVARCAWVMVDAPIALPGVVVPGTTAIIPAAVVVVVVDRLAHRHYNHTTTREWGSIVIVPAAVRSSMRGKHREVEDQTSEQQHRQTFVFFHQLSPFCFFRFLFICSLGERSEQSILHFILFVYRIFLQKVFR